MGMKEWILAFQADRMMAFHHVPENVWSDLHPEYIDHELDLTQKARELLND